MSGWENMGFHQLPGVNHQLVRQGADYFSGPDGYAHGAGLRNATAEQCRKIVAGANRNGQAHWQAAEGGASLRHVARQAGCW